MTRMTKAVAGVAIALGALALVAIAYRHVRAVPAASPSSGPGTVPVSASASAPARVSTDATAATGAKAATTPIEFDDKELLARADRMAARAPRVDWDVDAKAASLAAGVAPAFAFVRDAVRYEAYAGVLRGAAGAYAARAGNATDRALLLARLLDAKHIRTQFAIGTLAAADCDRLVAHVFDADSPADSLAESPAGAPASADTSPEPAADGLFAHVRARAEQDYRVVRAALGDRLPPVTKPSRTDLIAEMNPHVWLQAEIDGRWIDLDPSLANAEIGQRLATLDRTVATVPPELFQRVHLTIVEEHLSNTAAGAGIERTTLLDVTRHAIDLIDRPIVLSHTEPSTMKGLGFAIAGAAGMQTHNRWTPSLTIGDELLAGSSVDVSSPAFVSESIQFELLWPGGRREVTRRVLLDRGGAAWRATRPLDAATLTAVTRTHGIPTAMQAMHVIWFSGGAHNLSDFAEALKDLSIDVAIEGVSGDETALADTTWPFAMQTFGWMVLTDNVMLPLLDATPGLRLYPDGVRIALFTQAIDADEGVTFISDLRRDDLRGVAAASTAAAGVRLAEKKLEFGLWQGALEQEALAAVARLGGVDPAAVESTSSTLTRDGVVVLPADAAQVSARMPNGTHPESAARLAATAAAGNLVVAPVKGLGARGAWWEIAAQTGDARAVTDLDLHGGIGPLKANKPGTQNAMGGQRTNLSPAARDARIKELKELQRLRQRAAIEQRAAQARIQYLQRSAAPAGPRGGGNEYGILVSAVTVVGGAAINFFAAMLVFELFSEAIAAYDYGIAHHVLHR